MSFTTRCPACGTMFKVVADQLKISEGWVRCGHCADVFDATAYLQPWTAPEADGTEPEPWAEVVAEPAPEPERVSQPDVPHVDPIDAGPGEPSPDPEGACEEDAPAPLPAPAQAVPRAEPDDEVESDFHGELERFAVGLGRLSAAQSVGRHGDTDAAFAEPTPSAGAAVMPAAPMPRELDPEPEPEKNADLADATDHGQSPAAPEPGFVRQARRQAFWRRPGVRIALSLVALVLVALLAAQWAVRERDRLAAWQPQWQPVLQQACIHLGCTLAPVRQIDAIVIDSTSLVNRLGNFYAFDLVLKNTASLALAMPALELSITDVGGNVISRRVFLPDEWPDAPAVLPANGSITVQFRLALAVGESTPMAGYNALVFYP
ncbi:DUF3426 domain-containing protein [Hydrogenophaga sp. BPS33]|uniref:DUF3426 domain-containing protein n=1 Tax=Hydrogenophaga sp. BPS33 TaxID=2651974 RepID=UPI001320473B|nr:DUF3426 domain-containing protein [Hydrogenophaga sp. BPS33]QHE87783.1 DUF3426 domain-containing protein [Hydrogenophaga sp. BPS33]